MMKSKLFNRSFNPGSKSMTGYQTRTQIHHTAMSPSPPVNKTMADSKNVDITPLDSPVMKS